MTCCFIGHRDFKANSEYECFLKNYITKLIEEDQVDKFIFGSRSEFDSFCFDIVADLQKSYSHIKLISYHCIHEYSYLKSEEEQALKAMSILRILKNAPEITCRLYDERYYFEEFNAGKNSYIKRNERMIKDSDYVVFYYNENNKSRGTKLMFSFAKTKKKKIFNIYNIK